MRYGFVILNYKSYEETKNCIQSIERIFGGGDVEILIIDNASNDKSVERFQKNYDKCKNIKIISLEDNIGFSRGNNIGYLYMKEKADVDFLFILNSDIEFHQENFKEKLQEIYMKTGFHICGPDVFAPYMKNKFYHGHQSPIFPWEYTSWYTKYNILSQKISYAKVKYRLMKKVYCVFIRGMQKVLVATFYRQFRKRFHINTGIHGSCIILSRNFIENKNILFEPETYFYYEELLLFLRVKREKLISVYSPDIQVIHLQGRSTNKRTEKEGNSDWIKKNLIESGYIYLQELEKMKEYE